MFESCCTDQFKVRSVVSTCRRRFVQTAWPKTRRQPVRARQSLNPDLRNERD